ncbi:MAG: hypothetical protein AABW90_02650 [Nanoarchaeota archaeon]
MDNDAKINISFLIIFVGLLLGLMVYPLVVARDANAHLNVTLGNVTTADGAGSGNFTINEDTTYVFNFTINHSAINEENLTDVNITIPANFTIGTSSISTGNITGVGSDFNAVTASNTSTIITFANANATSTFSFHDNNATCCNSSGRFVWVNLTAGTPGKYNITIQYQFNNSAITNQTNISVTVNDTTIPYNVNITSNNSDFGLNRSYANVSGVININITAYDNGNLTAGAREYDVRAVNVSFWRGSTVNASYSALNLTNPSWNISVNTSTLDDGVYNITIAVNDTLNNVNITNITNLRIDNTKPTATVSCTPKTLNAGETVTCSCSPTDPTSGVNTSMTSITTNPSTVNTGTFTQGCTFGDMSGNTNTGSTTYTVELGGSSGGGGGGGGGGAGSVEAEAARFYTKTIPVIAKEFKDVETITQQLSAKERVKVKIDEVIHFVGVREMTATSAIVEIASDPVQVELQVGEDTKVDVNDDNFYDVYVKLNSIVNGKADLVIKYLHESYTPTLEEEAAAGEEEAPTGEGEKANLTWLWILIVVIVIVVIAYFVWKMKR